MLAIGTIQLEEKSVNQVRNIFAMLSEGREIDYNRTYVMMDFPREQALLVGPLDTSAKGSNDPNVAMRALLATHAAKLLISNNSGDLLLNS
jgi:hypothetical protein